MFASSSEAPEMIGKEILEEKIIPQAEVREILEEILKNEEEPVYEQKVTLDFLRKFVKISREDAEKAIKELLNLSEKIKPRIAVKLVDLLPSDEDEVRAVFAKERFTLTNDEVGEILKVLDKYRPK